MVIIMNQPPLPPQPLGLRTSFGFGDRLGVATPGHLAAARKYDFAPIFAQQSIREMERTARTPQEVMASKDPLVDQFVHAREDGPVPFHYPGPSVAQDFGGGLAR